MTTARTFLFVPGDRPDRFAKAMASGADAVVLDLEDAVAPPHKRDALANVVAFLAERGADAGGPPVVVRVNTDGVEGELTALAGVGHPLVVMVPKAESAGVLAEVRALLPAGSGTIPLLETAAGLLDVREVAEAPGVLRLAFGHLDLCAQLGLSPDDDRRLGPARFALVVASAAASLPPPVDGVATAITDDDETTRATRSAVASGFTGKLCIHPRQVAVVHEALLPTGAELAWARSVTGSGAGEGASSVDGEFVDRPVLLRAEAILARARGAGTS
ncbi:CoA ester lyase [Knoellia locipacati]|uniref:HpcH/HpaI aldolase/citrate lyase family protein n=1 Tax=Knoellia locipacati TaxID=882824 RepID=UPI0031ECF6E3